MRRVGVDPESALLRMPLSLRFADGGGLRLPPTDAARSTCSPASWLRAAGPGGTSAGCFAPRWRWQAGGFPCDAQCTVGELCHRLTPRVMRELIEPLCLSALNTPMQQASGAVFLRVLQDALFAVRGGADLLLPRTDLGALLPDAALRRLGAAGHALRLGHAGGAHRSIARGTGSVDGEAFDRSCSRARLGKPLVLPAAWPMKTQGPKPRRPTGLPGRRPGLRGHHDRLRAHRANAARRRCSRCAATTPRPRSSSSIAAWLTGPQACWPSS